ncbi:hypothetical protein AKJ44_01700 [candidate division MSBL1 archaeon SCGC-AAA261F17]|uniref:Uncharacterized protein n=1 Tax=candidate division MSBL1 archaeon SCGC-AAA261F17 TaxID=1698274 RepID=A0A133V6A8_9EURY|nr:hypothetical protein AKJ44_01700 [candidate division MSBL1 archaeon SCGC-AAA261F17]
MNLTNDYYLKLANFFLLYIIEAPNVSEALRLRPIRSHIIRWGDIITKTSQKSEITQLNEEEN